MGKKRNKEELPKITIRFNRKERKKLHGEPAELWQLYIVISSLRDFATNIAGIKTLISDRTFKEQMEVSGKQGRKKWRPATSLIQRWLQQLENLGLIKAHGNYVFYCPLASAPKSIKNISDQTATISATRTATNFKTNKNHGKLYKNRVETERVKMEVLPEVRLQVRPQLNTPPYLDLTDHDHLSSSLYCAELDKKNTDDHFDEFWATYPKKIGKKYAEQIWKRKKLNIFSIEIIEDVKQKILQDTQWQDGFIPNASTYLNQERWNDEIIRNRPGNTQSTQSYQSVRNQNATFYEQGFKALDEHTARKRKD